MLGRLWFATHAHPLSYWALAPIRPCMLCKGLPQKEMGFDNPFQYLPLPIVLSKEKSRRHHSRHRHSTYHPLPVLGGNLDQAVWIPSRACEEGRVLKHGRNQRGSNQLTSWGANRLKSFLSTTPPAKKSTQPRSLIAITRRGFLLNHSPIHKGSQEQHMEKRHGPGQGFLLSTQHLNHTKSQAQAQPERTPDWAERMLNLTRIDSLPLQISQKPQVSSLDSSVASPNLCPSRPGHFPHPGIHLTQKAKLSENKQCTQAFLDFIRHENWSKPSQSQLAWIVFPSTALTAQLPPKPPPSHGSRNKRRPWLQWTVLPQWLVTISQTFWLHKVRHSGTCKPWNIESEFGKRPNCICLLLKIPRVWHMV